MEVHRARGLEREMASCLPNSDKQSTAPECGNWSAQAERTQHFTLTLEPRQTRDSPQFAVPRLSRDATHRGPRRYLPRPQPDAASCHSPAFPATRDALRRHSASPRRTNQSLRRRTRTRSSAQQRPSNRQTPAPNGGVLAFASLGSAALARVRTSSRRRARRSSGAACPRALCLRAIRTALHRA